MTSDFETKMMHPENNSTPSVHQVSNVVESVESASKSTKKSKKSKKHHSSVGKEETHTEVDDTIDNNKSVGDDGGVQGDSHHAREEEVVVSNQSPPRTTWAYTIIKFLFVLSCVTTLSTGVFVVHTVHTRPNSKLGKLFVKSGDFISELVSILNEDQDPLVTETETEVPIDPLPEPEVEKPKKKMTEKKKEEEEEEVEEEGKKEFSSVEDIDLPTPPLKDDFVAAVDVVDSPRGAFDTLMERIASLMKKEEEQEEEEVVVDVEVEVEVEAAEPVMHKEEEEEEEQEQEQEKKELEKEVEAETETEAEAEAETDTEAEAETHVEVGIFEQGDHDSSTVENAGPCIALSNAVGVLLLIGSLIIRYRPTLHHLNQERIKYFGEDKNVVQRATYVSMFCGVLFVFLAGSWFLLLRDSTVSADEVVTKSELSGSSSTVISESLLSLSDILAIVIVVLSLVLFTTKQANRHKPKRA
jgi:hypothetical protein